MKALLRATVAIGIALGIATQPAAAMTVGEFRTAYNTLHALDPMTPKDRATYMTTHRAEIDLARVRLESSVLVRDPILRVNGILVEQGRLPFLCNYDLEEVDDEMDLYGWVNEFRAEALEKHKLVAGPKTDKMLDLVEFDDVIAHKMMEKYPCPASLQAKGFVPVPNAENPSAHQHP
jgi:hypothetical protein